MLVRRYQTRMANFAQAIVRDVGGAEDVAQETFVRAYKSLGRFRGDSVFRHGSIPSRPTRPARRSSVAVDGRELET